jgi:Terminase RNaseH-like domain
VLIEDQASGTSLLQELRADNFHIAQPAPKRDGDKAIRLRAQTAKIEEGSVLFPNNAPWLDAYLRELLGFPNKKNDDQVDSTVFALAWITEHPEPAALTFVKKEAERIRQKASAPGVVSVWVPGNTTHLQLNGRMSAILIPADRIVEVTPEESIPILQMGGRPVD